MSVPGFSKAGWIIGSDHDLNLELHPHSEMGSNKRANTYLVAVLIGVGVFCCSCRTADRTPTIVTINGRKVHRSEFDRFLRTKLGDLTAGDITDSLKSQMLDEFIVRNLELAEAQRLGLTVTESEIEQTTQDPQMKSSAATEEARIELGNDLLVSKYYRNIVLRDVRVSPDEVQRYIDENRAGRTDKAGFYVREIRVETREDADRLWKEVTEKNRDFATIVRQYSQVPNAEQGGLTYYTDGQLPEALENAIKLLRPGDVSPVIQSSFGYHIFKLERRTEPHPGDPRRANLDEDRSRLIEDAIERKNQQAVDKAVQALVSAASIKIDESAAGFTYVGRMGHN
jgi:parvulin-like peptidyl-prolyl isomerase